MIELRESALILGGAMAAFGAVSVVCPASMQVWLARFPRTLWLGWILTGVDLLWSAWLLFNMPMERFESLKPLLYVFTPVLFFLVVTLMDDLLASRALGGLLVLIPLPLLDAVRWHASPWRLVVVVLAYILVAKGIALLLSPHLFRKATTAFMGTSAGCRLWGSVSLGLGVGVGCLGFFVY